MLSRPSAISLAVFSAEDITDEARSTSVSYTHLGQDYYLDLLFYHLRLRCYVVIDLKMKAFAPEFAGKMNFYLSAVDDQLRHADDRPSIGLLLCKERDHLTVEYALRDLKKPIGVAQWQTKLVESLPRNLKGSLPTVAEIEAELDNARAK